VLVHQLIPNEDIRRQVEQVTKASKASVLAAQKEPQKPQSGFSLTAALKDRVNRPRKHAEEIAAGGDQPLALTDGSASQPAPAQPPPNWQPLAFGPLLTPEQFARWQQTLRTGDWTNAKAQFEDWQRRVKAAASPFGRTPPLGA
ncbi:hypothetical protein AK812_SmicGene46521, partial [Symbiodinium microadriaticum]